MSVDLKTFVAKSILSIIEGVNEAQFEVAKLGGSVNPSAGKGSEPFNQPVIVDFSVAVTAEEQGSGDAKISLKVFSVGGTLDGKLAEKSASASRLAFAIPVQLPLGEKVGLFNVAQMAAQVAAARGNSR
ncbi:MAG: hypothetical protein RL145_1381 [Pseudomonadota bacterium]